MPTTTGARPSIPSFLILLAFLPNTANAVAQEAARASDEWIESRADKLVAINRDIWSRPEVGLEETMASERLAAFLEANGFSLQRGVAGMPTAFLAEAGSGRPVIAILAEYDALPGMSQKAEPVRGPRDDDNDAGHACGHSVFGTASTAAAAAAAAIAQRAGFAGTIRLYGTPAEETGIGKVYMARSGLFDDVDAALHWHVSDKTRVVYAGSKAIISLKMRFSGRPAHASRSPEAGRSALDAVELMNVGVNYLREHLKDDARIHYVITDGGGQPNVVPPTAEVWYYLRADSHAYVEYILERVREIASGAALMTRTELEEQIDSDLFELLPNRPLSEVLQAELARVGPPLFDESEREFARATQSDLDDVPDEPLSSAVELLADEPWRVPASTDVGNVSWRVPTSGLNVACYTNGAPGHSWQIVACTGNSIGEKGMLVAAKVLSSATLALLADPTRVEEAGRDFAERLARDPRPETVLPADAVAPTRIR